MMKLYYHPSPNPLKIALFLEETGMEYELVPVDTRKGEQHDPAFLAINPNAKTPALTDGDAVIFDSTAILLYLAEKSGKYVPTDNTAKAQMLSWLMFVATGIGPYSGQCVHFRHIAPEPKEYALNRYDFEAHRHWQLINDQLEGKKYMLGDEYSIVDMAVWGWARAVPFILGGDDAFAKLPNVKRLLDDINARPAAQRAEAVKDKFAFKADMDDEAKKAMFPQNARLKG